MQLIDSTGPNPRMVRMFLLEKDMTLPSRSIDILSGDNRKPEYTARNPAGQVPALELDDGTLICETVVICEYLEEQQPEPPLIGATAFERAQTRMWVRRIEEQITANIYNGFRFAEGLGLFQNRMHCMPEAADSFKHRGQLGLQWLDGLLGDGPYLCGARLTVADLALYCCLDFAGSVGQPRTPGLDPCRRLVPAHRGASERRGIAESGLGADRHASLGASPVPTRTTLQLPVRVVPPIGPHPTLLCIEPERRAVRRRLTTIRGANAVPQGERRPALAAVKQQQIPARGKQRCAPCASAGVVATRI